MTEPRRARPSPEGLAPRTPDPTSRKSYGPEAGPADSRRAHDPSLDQSLRTQSEFEMAEKRPNEAQDPSGRPLGSNLDAPSGPIGNRPAHGAREAHSPQAADSGWQPGAGATDFLGLEPDLRGGAANSEGPTESWLFDIEQNDQAGAYAQSTTAVETRIDEDEEATEYASTEPDADEFGDTDEPIDAGLDDAGESEDDSSFPAEPARRGPSRVLAAVAILALLSAGGWYGWQHYGQRVMNKFGLSTFGLETASTQPARPTPSVAPPSARPKPAQPIAKTPGAVTPPVERDPAPVAETDPAPTSELGSPDPTTSETDPQAVATTIEIPPTVGEPRESTPSTVVQPEPPAPAPEPSLVRGANAPAKDPELPGGAPGPGGGRHATSSDWAGMWLESTIPVDAIHGPTRLRTINVGLVRAELVNGEFVEGRLQAVGESRIWLDVKLGRLAFDAIDIRHLVQIVGAQGQPLPLGTQAVAGLPRVEVLLPGGTLTGHVLAREGDRVTFLTEDGMRMRVDALEVRPVANGRSRLIGPAAKHKP